MKKHNGNAQKRKRHSVTNLARGMAHKKGLPPGTLVHVGQERTEEVAVTLMEYGEQSFTERKIEDLEAFVRPAADGTVTWINVDGLQRVDVLEKLGQSFCIHPLVLEDILNTNQRPKFDDYGDYVFIVLKMIYYNGGGTEIVTEQVSLVLGSDYLLTFQEAGKPGDVFDIIRDRIRNNKGRMRKMKADYLAYALIDAIVDYYFIILENMGEAIESQEEALIADPSMAVLERIHDLRSEMLALRRSVWPLREVVSSLERGESSLIRRSTLIYLRDVYDHTIQVIDTIETYRDILSSMMDIYLSSTSNRLNEVMKVLTIFSTLFIPLTFLVGIYGMNFKHMPELESVWGYPVLWGVMIAVVIVLLAFFRRRKWL